MTHTKTHKHNGSTLKDGVLGLGYTITDFSKESKLSLTSLRKIFEDAHVRESTRNKAWVALRRLQRRNEATTI
jgi:predicted transcriptional regulator|nr:hypothetical protein HAGR004_24880 [Bdellovibrio sp. HAGR004]